VVHHWTDPIRQRLSRAVSPCWRAQSLQQLTISVDETLGPGGTEARAFLAGILATATVAGQTRTYAPEFHAGGVPQAYPGAYPESARERAGVTDSAVGPAGMVALASHHLTHGK
jgi:hypothetical protein